MLESDHSLNIAAGTKVFLDFGGIETINSYGVNLHTAKPGDFHDHIIRKTALGVSRDSLVMTQKELSSPNAVSPEHLRFLKELKISHRSGDYFFVHAGIDPSLSLQEQPEHVLVGLSKRARDFAEYKGTVENDIVVVHGHTILQKPVVTQNQINIDTGIYKEGFGILSCAILRGKKC